jgi:uncharacterized membrane protein (UPF0127 family)
MKPNIKFWLILIPVAIVLFIIASVYTVQTAYKTTVVTMGGQTFATEISDTPYLQERGLSYRKSIGVNNAMLFVFPQDGVYKFWMKDMNFPIDIIWLSSDKKIMYIEKNLSPSTFPQTFGPDGQSHYVVEVVAGTSDRLNLTVGQSVSFSL